MTNEVINTENDENEFKIIKNNTESQDETSAKVLDGGYGWIIVGASFLINVIVDGLIFTMGAVYLPAWVNDFQISEAKASITMSVLTACYFFIGPLCAAFCDVFGCRQVAAIGALISTTGFITSIFAPNVYTLYVTFGLIGGSGLGLMYLPAIVVISQYFNVKRSLATGIAVCGSGIGTTIFAFLNEKVFELFERDWRKCLMYTAAIALSGFFVSLLFKPASSSQNKTRKTLVDDAETKTSSAVKDDEKIYIKEVYEANDDLFGEVYNGKINQKQSLKQAITKLCDKSLLSSPPFLILAISGTLTLCCFYVPFMYLEKHLEKIPNLSATEKTLPISLIGILNIIARIGCGYVADHPKVSALMVNNISLIAAGAATCLVPVLDRYWLFLLYCLPFSIGVACFAALRSIICVELIGVDKLSSGFGILLTFMGFGAIVGSPIAAYVKDITGNFDTSFYIMGSLMILSGLICIPLQKLTKKSELSMNSSKKDISN